MKKLTNNRSYFIWLSYVIIFIGVVLRWSRIKLLSIWSDEYHSIFVIRNNFQDIFLGNYRDFNPPFYYLILKVFVSIFGETEYLMRILSLIFSFLSMLLLFLIAKNLFKDGSPLQIIGSLLIFSFHPLFILYSTEIRSYSLLVFLFLGAVYSYLMIRKDQKNVHLWFFLLTLCLITSFYTHHFGFLTFLSILIVSLLDISKSSIPKISKILSTSSLFLSILIYIPGFFNIFLKQLDNYPESITNPVPPNIFLNIFRLSIKPSLLDNWISIIGILAFIFGIILFLKNNTIDINIRLWLWISIVLAFVFIFGSFFFGINLLPRYFIHISVFVFIIIAALLDNKCDSPLKTFGYIIGVTLVALYIAYGVEFTSNTKFETQAANWKTDWKLVSNIIRDIQYKDEPVVILSWDSTPVQFYLQENVLGRTELLTALEDQKFRSIIIVISENSAEIQNLPYHETLYTNQVESVQVLRVFTQDVKNNGN